MTGAFWTIRRVALLGAVLGAIYGCFDMAGTVVVGRNWATVLVRLSVDALLGALLGALIGRFLPANRSK
jgi:hypothetical protein